MIFQDPTSSLNPVHRIGRQIGEALRMHRGLGGSAARSETLRLLDRVGLPAPERQLDRYPHELSGGMNQRVMIAMALAGEPEVLIADEPTTALDATVQAQILDLMIDIRRDTGMGLVLISHDLGAVAQVCDRVAVMYAGRILETAATDALLDRPAHPYTRGLLGAMPDIEGPRRRLKPVAGVVPPPGALPFVTPEHAALPEPHVYADIMHCVECIREGKPPVASGEHAAHVIEIIEAGYRAARTGETQALTTTFQTLL